MQVQEYTMADYINAINNEKITMKSLQYQDILTDKVSGTRIVVNDRSVLKMYRKDLKEGAYFVILNNNEKRKYFYKPWSFCYDVYGTSDLWFELLNLNQIRSFNEFDHEKIRVFDPAYLNKLKVILNLEEDVINQKTDEMIEAIKEATLA